MNAERGQRSGFAASEQLASPPEERPASALVSYLRALRAHLGVVVAIAATTIAASLAWVLYQETRYEASAQILVSPLPAEDPSFVGLPLVRAVGRDSASAVQTASSLLSSRGAVRRTADELGISRATVTSTITVEPVADSNLIEVKAESGDPEFAATAANQYAHSALASRRARLRPRVEEAIARVREQLAAVGDPASLAAEPLQAQLSTLEAIADGEDPTLSISSRAVAPDAPIGPPAWIVLGIAGIGGLVLGIAVAVLMELLAPRRIADEADLLDTYPLAVLARVPPLPVRDQDDGGREQFRERFRGLRVQLELARPVVVGAGGGNGPEAGAGGAVVALTSGSRGDGRTTAAVNLGWSFATARQTTIVVDLDLGNPAVATRLALAPLAGLEDLYRPGADVDKAIVRVPRTRGLWALAAPPVTDGQRLEASLHAMPEIVEQLRMRADWVIIDTPPLPAAGAILPLVREADFQLVVARPGNTRYADLSELRDLMVRGDTAPFGYIMFGGRTGGLYRVFSRRHPAEVVDPTS
jgi:Mrp family chromosome partitioning ATPase/capsular polysaccharide biosynthesis protein